MRHHVVSTLISRRARSIAATRVPSRVHLGYNRLWIISSQKLGLTWA